jgi:hypothetical protein
MQKIIFNMAIVITLFGVASCKPAPAAEWVVFEAAPEATLYIDPSTIHKDGSRADMWVLIDYKNPQSDKTGKKVLSDKIHYQYDCAAKQLSITETSAHTGAMGAGEIVNITPDAPEVMSIPAGTTAEKLWQRACGAEQ